MKQIFLIGFIVCTLVISGCQTAKVMAEYGDNIAFVEASDLDKSGNREEAFNKYLSIANNDSYSGAQSAQYRVAQGYLKGDGVHKNLSLAIEWFQRTAKGPDLTWSNHANYALVISTMLTVNIVRRSIQLRPMSIIASVLTQGISIANRQKKA